jgi:colanic acid/amylovoran biosynthesis glycosyltransferase
MLLCYDSLGMEQFGCPVLSHLEVWRLPRTFPERVINAVRFRWRSYLRPGLGRINRRRVISFFEVHQPKVVLAEYGPMGCLLAGTCQQARIPLFVHFHGFDASILLRDWRRVWHYRMLFRSVTGIIIPSQFLARKLMAIGCPEAKLHVNTCGVDTRIFAPKSQIRRQLLIAVGRLVEKKAPHRSIHAFARIAHRYPAAKLDIVGDGPLAHRCRTLIATLGLDDRIRMHGAQDSKFIARLMQEASLFVQHSVTAPDGDTEGGAPPVAILEAMASGLPVISTRHASIPEGVMDGVTGLLVAENDVDAMACAMDELLDNPARAAAMGAAGREHVLAHFTREMARDRLRAIMGFPPLGDTQVLAA